MQRLVQDTGLPANGRLLAAVKSHDGTYVGAIPICIVAVKKQQLMDAGFYQLS